MPRPGIEPGTSWSSGKRATIYTFLANSASGRLRSYNLSVKSRLLLPIELPTQDGHGWIRTTMRTILNRSGMPVPCTCPCGTCAAVTLRALSRFTLLTLQVTLRFSLSTCPCVPDWIRTSRLLILNREGMPIPVTGTYGAGGRIRTPIVSDVCRWA